MQCIMVDNVAIHYQLSGDADRPLVVFVNSLGTDFRIWHDCVTALRGHYHCLCYDKRGHGLSGDGFSTDDATKQYSINLLTDDLVALLDCLGLKQKIILVGLSVGGQIAQNFAFLYPNRVAALVLLDTAAKIGTKDSWNERIDFIMQHGMQSLSEQIMARWLTHAYHKQHQALYAGYQNMLERTSKLAYCATAAALRDSDLSENTAQITMPVLVMVGEDDAATPPALVENMAKSIKNAKFIRIKNCGHLPCIEQPQILIDHLHRFITEIAHV